MVKKSRDFIKKNDFFLTNSKKRLFLMRFYKETPMMDVDKFLDRIGLNQSKLAEKLGITPASITKWKKGGGVDLVYLDQLLKMGMKIEEMFTDEAWEAVKKFRAEELRQEVELSPEECAQIVQAGIQMLKKEGREVVVLRQVQDQASKG